MELYREIDTGISGSLKATEETVGRLQKRETRRREAVRAVARTRRREAFEGQIAEISPASVESLYENAMEALGDAKSDISEEAYGRFLAWAQAGILSVSGSIDPVLQ